VYINLSLYGGASNSIVGVPAFQSPPLDLSQLICVGSASIVSPLPTVQLCVAVRCGVSSAACLGIVFVRAHVGRRLRTIHDARWCVARSSGSPHQWRLLSVQWRELRETLWSVLLALVWSRGSVLVVVIDVGRLFLMEVKSAALLFVPRLCSLPPSPRGDSISNVRIFRRSRMVDRAEDDLRRALIVTVLGQENSDCATGPGCARLEGWP
jgi:hypothetical protein